MIPHLTLDDAIRLLNEAIEFRGEGWVDPNSFGGPNAIPGSGQCKYTPENGLRCGVGEVLHRVGVSDSTLLVADREALGAQELRSKHVFSDAIYVDEDAEKFLAEFQSYQDMGRTWAEARSKALELVGAVE